MTENAITITLDDILGPEGIDGAWDALIERLTSRVESKMLHSDAGGGAGKTFHKVAVESINRAIQDRLVFKIDSMMGQVIQPTNSYGEASGPATTFAEMIGHAVESAAQTQVDQHGKPTTGRGRYTLLEYALKRVAVAELDKAVTAEVKKINADAKKAVADQVAKSIAKSLQ